MQVNILTRQEISKFSFEYFMKTKSIPTRGRTLDHAAFVYDLLEPVLMLGKQKEYDLQILSLLDLTPADRVLDLGCGTGVLTRMIADQLNGEAGGISLGIDAAAKMINVARKKRETETCGFEVAAAEDLPFDNSSFDAVLLGWGRWCHMFRDGFSYNRRSEKISGGFCHSSSKERALTHLSMSPLISDI
jgi:ubiquinone/menaquinone biosynthesis C-methylase UbiE